MKVPDPVFFCSVSSESQSTEEDLKEALKSLQLEDPSFKWVINKDTGQWYRLANISVYSHAIG